jgi:membrane glycosyltransferase
MKRFIILLALSIIAVLLVQSELFAQGCSQCKLLSEQGSELDENSFGSNINTGILYLMIIPYLLLMFLFRKRIFGFLRTLKR